LPRSRYRACSIDEQPAPREADPKHVCTNPQDFSKQSPQPFNTAWRAPEAAHLAITCREAVPNTRQPLWFFHIAPEHGILSQQTSEMASIKQSERAVARSSCSLFEFFLRTLLRRPASCGWTIDIHQSLTFGGLNGAISRGIAESIVNQSSDSPRSKRAAP